MEPQKARLTQGPVGRHLVDMALPMLLGIATMMGQSFIDAWFLGKVGDRALAVTALSPTYPAHEQTEAAGLATSIGIRHVQISSNELEIDHFADNPPNRCYYCKAELFTVVREAAARHGESFSSSRPWRARRR